MRRFQPTRGIANKIPAGIRVPADVCVRYDECCDKFNDFVEGAEPHAGQNTDSQYAEAGNADCECLLDCLPAYPCCSGKPERMDNIIELEMSGDNPPAVEHMLVPSIGQSAGKAPVRLSYETAPYSGTAGRRY